MNNEHPMPVQVDLLDMDTIPPDVSREVRRVCNGKLTDARLSNAIVMLLGARIPVRQICETLRVSPHTVQVVEVNNLERVATLKERLAAKCEFAAGVLADGILERAVEGAFKPAEMGLTLGILLTKAGELRGEANVRIAHVEEKRLSEEDLIARAKRLKAAVIDCESSVSEPKPLSCNTQAPDVAADVAAGSPDPAPIEAPDTQPEATDPGHQERGAGGISEHSRLD